MTKGSFGNKLSKKSGNYVGKVRGSADKNSFLLLGKDDGIHKTEYAFVEFQKKTMTSFFDRKYEPRKLKVILPPLVDGKSLPNLCTRSAEDISTSQSLGNRKWDPEDMSVVSLFNKPPVLGPDNIYRLDFMGRVKLSSVKNVQLISQANPSVSLQFGKADPDVYHLDFRAPFTPFQAFGIAVAQCAT